MIEHDRYFTPFAPKKFQILLPMQWGGGAAKSATERPRSGSINNLGTPSF